MLSNDYNVLRSTVIAMNNFILCSHCQAVQPFRLTLFLIKALTTSICNTRCVPYREASWGAFDPVGIIYAWVLITESRTVLARNKTLSEHVAQLRFGEKKTGKVYSVFIRV